MSRRASTWVLSESKKGTWDLTRGGRALYEGMGSEAEALQRLKNHYRPGEPVMQEAPDGYRTNITGNLRKKGLI